MLVFFLPGTFFESGVQDIHCASLISQLPGSLNLGRSEGSSSRRVVDTSSREPFSGGSDNANYETALKGIDGLRINNNAGDETAATPQLNGDDVEPKAKLSD